MAFSNSHVWNSSNCPFIEVDLDESEFNRIFAREEDTCFKAYSEKSFKHGGHRQIAHPLLDAVEENDMERVERLLNERVYIEEKECCGKTPLQSACSHGNLKMVMYLIEHGAEIESTNFENYTPLCLAAIACHPQLVRYLLDLGAKVNPPLMMGSPLHEACSRTGTDKVHERAGEVVRVLLEYHADVDCNDCHYGTPLHAACSRFCPDVGVIESLLISGANPNCLQNHRTPLHLIAQYSESYECAVVLVSYGAKTELRDSQNRRPADLVDRGTPLHSLLMVERQQPFTLCLLARVAARKAIGMQRLDHIDDMRLPPGLKNILRHDIQPPCQCCREMKMKA